MADFSAIQIHQWPGIEPARNAAETIAFLLAAGGGETDPPSVSITTPSALASRTSPVLFSVIDASPLARVTVAARFTGLRRTELVYDGAAFHVPYGSSTRVGDAFTIRRTDGWPSGFELVVGAVDDEGNAV